MTKKYCIGHIHERLGTKLRNLRKEVKNLGARGKLTGKFIDELSVYYGLATRRKERIADAYTAHDSAVSLIKYDVGPVVSMG